MIVLNVIKIMKNVPVEAIFTGKKMNSIVRVGDGDRLYREQSQWNLSGDRRVSIVLRD
jgi:hypothetical protein